MEKKEQSIRLIVDRFKRDVIDLDTAYEQIKEITNKDVNTAFFMGILLGGVIAFILTSIF